MKGPRGQIKRMYRAAVAAVDPRTAVRQALDASRTGDLLFDVDTNTVPIHLIAIGKASEAMTLGALDAIGNLVISGIAVSKEPPVDGARRVSYYQGSHPVPDERSLKAGAAVLDFVEQLPENALVVCLISGGASALVESLRPGVTLDDLRSVTRTLLAGGAPIEDLNMVRSRLSRIKGGGLLHALGERRVVNLIISDVLGDNLQAIASGPTVRPDTVSTAEEVAYVYGLESSLPPALLMNLSPPHHIELVANLPCAVEAAAVQAENLGLRAVVLTERLEGEAREVGKIVARILGEHNHERNSLRRGDCVLAGGETTVTVRGDGTGGRNTECALAAAIELSDVETITVGFLATDGDDGETNAAGAIVDGATISPGTLGRARRALANNDSYGFLSETGAVWAPGPTGTNVNDLMIAIIE